MTARLPIAALLAACAGGLAGCEEANMASQERAKTWDRSTFFADRLTLREPVPGTVPRDDPARAVPQPATITPAMLALGQERYATFCAPCHALDGSGRGMIVTRGFPAAPPLDAPRLRQARAAELDAVIAKGKGAMYGLAAQIPSGERWAIVAYLRALQTSRDIEVASLPPEDRDRLEASR